MTALGFPIKYVLLGSAFAPHSNPFAFKGPKEANMLRRTIIAFSNGMASALLIVGFGVGTFSLFSYLVAMGVAGSAIIAAALLCDVLVIPALLRLVFWEE